MEDMLSMIVEMDEKVRIETKQAEQRKADSFKKITKQREDIYNDYINRARERIKKNEKTERAAAEKKWQQIPHQKIGELVGGNCRQSPLRHRSGGTIETLSLQTDLVSPPKSRIPHRL